MNNNHDIRTKTRLQIAAEYGITRKTFYNWLKKEGITFKSRRLVSPKEVELIYEVFGIPKSGFKNK